MFTYLQMLHVVVMVIGGNCKAEHAQTDMLVNVVSKSEGREGGMEEGREGGRKGGREGKEHKWIL